MKDVEINYFVNFIMIKHSKNIAEHTINYIEFNIIEKTIFNTGIILNIFILG